jgi:2-polyprenyl-3-methyl-5-hydroxy-6-metoxy-1,4-benzoquinol methylase
MEPLEVVRETVPCTLCGIDDTELVHQACGQLRRGVYLDGIFRPVAGLERIVRCRGCGLTYVNPRLAPAQGLRTYSVEEEAAYFQATQADREADNTLLLQRIETLLGGAGRLLDVGCGDGLLLAQAQSRGWEPWGLEVSEALVTQIRDRHRLMDVFYGMLSKAAYPSAFFDAIVVVNVIEHLRDPAETMASVARIVRPGGIVAVHTPNVDSLEARWRGPAWHHYEPLEHFYYFGPNTLGLLLEKSGLEVIGSFVLPGASKAKRWLMMLIHWLGLRLDNSLGLLARRLT